MLRFTHQPAQILKSTSHPTHVTTSDAIQANRHWCGSWLIAASQGSMPAQEMDVDTSCDVRLQQVLIWTIIPIDDRSYRDDLCIFPYIWLKFMVNVGK